MYDIYIRRAEFLEYIQRDEIIDEGVDVIFFHLHHLAHHAYTAGHPCDIPHFFGDLEGFLVQTKGPVIVTLVLINDSHLMTALRNPGDVSDLFRYLKSPLVEAQRPVLFPLVLV